MAAGRVKLKSFRLKGYRSCKATELTFEPTVTVLIGPNGSGKTNLMHGLRLLSGNRRRILRGGPERDQYALRSQIYGDFSVGKKGLRLKVEITFRPGSNGADIPLSAKETWDLTEFGIKEPWVKIQHVGTLRIGGAVLLDYGQKYNSKLSIVHQRRGKASTVSTLEQDAADAVAAVNKFRSNIDYYSASQFTNPSACPTSFEVDEDGDLADPVLARRNTQLRFVHDLYRISVDDEDAYNNYLNLVGVDGIRLVEEINWQETTFSSTSYEVRSGGKIINKKRERILIIPVVTVSGQQLSFDQLSEGTFRTLAILFHLMTDTGSLLLLEEPEVCVHYGLLASVIEVIKDRSARKQIVISTHSEALLDSMVPEQIRLVKRGERSGTKAIALSRSMSAKRFGALKDYLRSEGNLGEYWRHSGFGQ